MQASTSEAVVSIGGITETISQMSEIAVAISTAVEQQGGATARDRPEHLQSVAAGSNEISTHIGGVTTAAAATGKAASEVLANARELDTQSGVPAQRGRRVPGEGAGGVARRLGRVGKASVPIAYRRAPSA